MHFWRIINGASLVIPIIIYALRLTSFSFNSFISLQFYQSALSGRQWTPNFAYSAISWQTLLYLPRFLALRNALAAQPLNLVHADRRGFVTAFFNQIWRPFWIIAHSCVVGFSGVFASIFLFRFCLCRLKTLLVLLKTSSSFFWLRESASVIFRLKSLQLQSSCVSTVDRVYSTIHFP